MLKPIVWLALVALTLTGCRQAENEKLKQDVQKLESDNAELKKKVDELSEKKKYDTEADALMSAMRDATPNTRSAGPWWLVDSILGEVCPVLPDNVTPENFIERAYIGSNVTGSSFEKIESGGQILTVQYTYKQEDRSSQFASMNGACMVQFEYLKRKKKKGSEGNLVSHAELTKMAETGMKIWKRYSVEGALTPDGQFLCEAIVGKYGECSPLNHMVRVTHSMTVERARDLYDIRGQKACFTVAMSPEGKIVIQDFSAGECA